MKKESYEKIYKLVAKILLSILYLMLPIGIICFYSLIGELLYLPEFIKNINWPPFMLQFFSVVENMFKVLYHILDNLLRITGIIVNSDTFNLNNNIMMIIIFAIQLCIFIKYLIKTKIFDYYCVGKEKYWSTIPENVPPYVATAIMAKDKKDIANSLAGELVMFIDKGYMLPVKIKDNYLYYFNKTVENDDSLWEYQKNLFNILYYTIAGGKGQLSLDDFEKIQNDKQRNYVVMKRMVKSVCWVSYCELIEKGYFAKPLENIDNEKKDNIIKKIFFYLKLFLLVLMSRIIVAAVHFKKYWVIIAYIFGGILWYLTRSEDREGLTAKGKASCKEWTSFKKFLKNYSKFEDRGIRDIILWHEALAYSVAFGIESKASQEVKYSGINELKNAWYSFIFNGNFAKIFKDETP